MLLAGSKPEQSESLLESEPYTFNEQDFAVELRDVDLENIQEVVKDLNIVAFAQAKLMHLQALSEVCGIGVGMTCCCSHDAQRAHRSRELLGYCIKRFTQAYQSSGSAFISHNLVGTVLSY